MKGSFEQRPSPAASAGREIVAQARNGAVYWRGVHKSPEECARLLDHLRRSYWQDTARPLAEQLQHAMQEAKYDA